MKCPHCQTEFFSDLLSVRAAVSDAARFNLGDDHYELDPYIQSTTCPKCKAATFFFRIEPKASSWALFQTQVYPRGGRFPAAPIEVPSNIATDYAEANEVLPVSPKASAALSRRCLQAILAAHGYTGRDLVKQIEAVLNETDTTKALPSGLRENIDSVRNFGNFSAHPITDSTTLQIVDVEEGEAEWCLQILLDCFDHYYVSPARAAEKRAALAAKLAAAGKPPMKTAAKDVRASELTSDSSE